MIAIVPGIVRPRVRRTTGSPPGPSDPRYPARDELTARSVRDPTGPLVHGACPVALGRGPRGLQGGKTSLRWSKGGRAGGTEGR